MGIIDLPLPLLPLRSVLREQPSCRIGPVAALDERYTDSTGRDPLGLSHGGGLTDYLLQGIITTTSRARYYSFHCWALWHIERHHGSAKYPEYLRAFPPCRVCITSA